MIPAALLKLVPIRDWLFLFVLVVLTAGGFAFIQHERSIGEAKAEARAQTQRAQQAAADLAELKRQYAALQEVSQNAQKTLAQMAQSAADNSADRDSFRVQLDTYLRAHRTTGAPGAAGSGPATNDAVVVLTRLLDRADARASELATLADQRGAAGLACERSYDAMTPDSSSPRR